MANGEPPGFADLLRRYRRAAGLTQETLAERAGISTRAISDLERGLYLAPRRDTVAFLARALELGEDDAALLEAAVDRRRGPRVDHGATVPPVIARPARPATSVPAARSLPLALTPLVGRREEAASVSALLVDPGVRLVTLSGPAGVGKTRLALQVATAVGGRFEDGVVFVALATIVDPDLVLAAIARDAGLHLGLRGVGPDDIAERLLDRRLLLVLDNFEQVVAAALPVAALLSACPDLTALVTSRSALRIRGERLVPLSPLSLPDRATVLALPETPAGPARLAVLDGLARSDAVRLFVERAQAVAPDFELQPEDGVAVAEICHQLDGLPLAIELAAARMTLLSPQEVLSRLAHPLALLTGGPRDLPERHQTLRGAIAWSYDLLSPEERALFRRLAVFAGGCTIRAATAVCAAAGPLAIDPLDGLAALVDHSLVQRDAPERTRWADLPTELPGRSRSENGPEGRLRILETLREFAHERLGASGELPAAGRAHARYYLALAERGERELMGPTLELWLNRLEQEHDNLRRVLRHSLDGGDARTALRLGAALSRFWSVRGHFREGWRWLEQALALPGAETLDAIVRARALGAAGILARAGNEYARAEALFEAGLLAARETAEYPLLAEALNNVGGAARAQGDAKRAMAHFEEALALPGIKAYPRTVVHTLFNLAMVARDGADYVRAQALLQQCLALQAVLGDRQSRAVTLNILASVASATGDHALAQALHQEGLDLQQAMGHKRGVAVSFSFMCVEAAATGDVARAVDLGRRGLIACREIGERWNTAECLAAIARIAWLQDQPRPVARLLGAADRLRDGSRVPVQHRVAETQLAEAARDRLGADVYDVCWTEGRALTFDGAVELGLAAASDAGRHRRRTPETAPAVVRPPVRQPALPHRQSQRSTQEMAQE